MKNCSLISKALLLVFLVPALLVFSGCRFFGVGDETEADKPDGEAPSFQEQLSVKDTAAGLYHYDPDKETSVDEPAEAAESDDGIFLGVIKDQGETWRRTQAAVDDGREGWRRDPEQVVLAEKATYGFNPKDKFALVQQVPLENGTNALVFSIGHKGQTYIAILGLAFPDRGEESIWVWKEIRKHEN